MINQPPLLKSFLTKILYKNHHPMAVDDGIHEILRLKSYQIQWESYGFHEVLQSKSYQTQWNSMMI